MLYEVVDILLLIRSSSTHEVDNHMPKHVGVELERINNQKNYYFIDHFLVFLLQDARFSHQDDFNEM
jgi:hypothetical protein